MPLKKILINIFFILLFIAGSFTIGSYEAPAQGDVVIIVHPSKPTLTASQIKRIFTGDVTSWPDGGSVTILLNRDNNITKNFCNKYLKISPSRLDDLWVKKSIRDGVPTPRKVGSNVITTMVSNSPKFIGYVSRAEAGSSVKIIN